MSNIQHAIVVYDATPLQKLTTEAIVICSKGKHLDSFTECKVTIINVWNVLCHIATNPMLRTPEI